jgi:hypothetical protein
MRKSKPGFTHLPLGIYVIIILQFNEKIKNKTVKKQTPSLEGIRNKVNSRSKTTVANVGIALFSRAVTHQVSSALKSLTTVFGMGTGGPS